VCWGFCVAGAPAAGGPGCLVCNMARLQFISLSGGAWICGCLLFVCLVFGRAALGRAAGALSSWPCLCGAFWPSLPGRASLPRPLGRFAWRAVAAPSRPRLRLVVPRLLWPRLLWLRLWPRFWPRLLGRAFLGLLLRLRWFRSQLWLGSAFGRALFGRAFSAAPFPPTAWLWHSSLLPSSSSPVVFHSGLRGPEYLPTGVPTSLDRRANERA
jgi:hypothetical protein